MQYKKINLMFPTHRRVKSGKLPRLVNSCIDCADDIKNICMTIVVNHDDYETLDWLAKRRIPCDHHIITTYLVKPHLARYFNHAFDSTRFNGEDCLVSMLGDDMYWETSGYDTRILEEVNRYDGVGVFYCYDGFSWGNMMCVNFFESRKWVTAMGKEFMCPKFAVDFIDVVHMRVGQLTNTMHLLTDVVLRHDHSTGKPEGEWDETFTRLRGHWPGAAQHMKMVPEYVDEIVSNIKMSGILENITEG